MTTPMGKGDVTDNLNQQVAQTMQVFGLNAREAILQVANAYTTGLRLVDQTDPEDTDGGEVRLYAMPDSPLCVNAWLVSPHGDASDITDPDVFLRGDRAVGFDTQELNWGWSNDDEAE
jgi:hypothetical protein